ncbi:MAG: ABC transporter permease [Terriglobia bacterium]
MFRERIHDFWLRVKALVRRRELDRDLDDELQFHLAMREQKLREQGVAAEEAPYAARRQFGNVTGLKETSRELWGFRGFEILLQDVRYGARQLRCNPGFTAVAVLTLALGIGANTVMFSVVNGILLRPLPYPDPGQLMTIVSVSTKNHEIMESVSVADFPFVKEQTDAFDGLALYGYSIPTLTGRGEPEQLAGGAATPGLFPLLGVRPLLGRNFLPDEATRGKSHVVILSHRLWRRRFGGDPAIIGKSVTLSEQLYTVIGVMPPGFAFPSAKTGLWLPLVLQGQEAVSHGWRSRRMLARLKLGVDLTRAQAELDTVGARLARQFPQDQAWGLQIVPLKEAIVGLFRHALLLLLGAVALVLLIACANLANLFLSRGRAREREMAIRCSLGATRRRVVRQLLTESLIIAAIGGALALLFVPAGANFIRAIAPADIPRLDQISVDGRVLWFVFGASMLTGVLFGLAPAIHVSKPDVTSALKDGFQTTPAGFGLFQAHRTRSALVVAEVAMAMVLMSGAVLLLRSLWKLVNVNPGFDPRNLLTMELSVTSRKFQDDKAQIAYFNQILESVAGLPGIKSAAVASGSPLYMTMSVGFDLGGRPSREESPQAGFEIVSPDYFRTLGIRLLEGRPFTFRDTENSPAMVIINQSFARRYLPGQGSLGKRIHVGWGKDEAGTDAQIAGVVSDLTPEDRPSPTMYVSYLQFGANGYMSLFVRTGTSPLAAADAVRRQIWSVNSEQPVANIRTVEQDISTTVAEPRFHTLLLGTFAGLALVLALVGIYGVMSYTVIQRTHEIGIRIALGAARTEILRLVLQQGLVFAGFGLAIGLGLSLFLTHLLRSLVFEVQPNDALTLVIASVVVTGMTLLAAFLPARRATKVDPMVALRYE